ncbi:MAG: 16S rRNA (cytosine(1402)-N(4))-methyltransferase RsmH [Polyangiaceae bacterium]|nr:16S rRNA (cytosine(1402)-N(4))-methyltransferase RsmH [Polyangiaceae bacterium]
MPAMVLEPSVPYSHVTVMRSEVVRSLDPSPGETVVDCTLGGGGHTEAILDAFPGIRVVAFDRDPAAVAAAGRRLARFGDRVVLVRSTFSDVVARLADAAYLPVAGLVADLGLSSAQIEDPSRGMSFRAEGPIDMRMDPDADLTALDLIDRLAQDELADLIYQLGDEKRSRRISSCIRQAHLAGELRTTLDLRRAIVRAVGPRRVGGIDPATRTFQALRIAVNSELRELEALLAAAPQVLRPGGVAVIVSFHSLEDRLVKRAFLHREVWQRLTRKPLLATAAEQAENPRSRSAKLRAASRL